MTPTTRSQRTRKIVALSAAGTVLAVGAISTLAAWNDSEWVWGGANSQGDPIGTSTFNV
ncbi:MAG TPA: SipW-dependent-type signal peptide-containing protein [Actinomycetaceae bacterium]|nr:SipW-dependent-type signal peptide-containing protein [Actinomycetaceae bacterium]